MLTGVSFIGFIVSFWLACWMLIKARGKFLERRGAPGIVLLLLAVGLFCASYCSFVVWYHRVYTGR